MYFSKKEKIADQMVHMTIHQKKMQNKVMGTVLKICCVKSIVLYCILQNGQMGKFHAMGLLTQGNS